MKTFIYVTLLLLISSFSHAEDWKPKGYEMLSDFEKNVIQHLTPIDQTNKTIVQLLLDSGTYQNCAIGTALRSDKIYLTIINKAEENKKYQYIVNIKEALVSPEVFQAQGVAMSILVFDQVAQDGGSETLFMYFYMSPAGELLATQVTSKKNIAQGLPIISKFIGKVEPSYNFNCQSK